MDILKMSKPEVIGLAVNEAITRLGLLKPAAHSSILAMVEDERGLHPRALATAYRKSGEQLSKTELKAIGVRANGFMSRRAYDELTEKGLGAPLDAHMTTALRATFTFFRWRTVLNGVVGAKNAGIAPAALSFRYDMIPPVCPTCEELGGTELTPQSAHILPPPGCECETANYSIAMHIDFFYGLE